MSDEQDKIYYCVADTYEAAANSPHIEGLKSSGTSSSINRQNRRVGYGWINGISRQRAC